MRASSHPSGAVKFVDDMAGVSCVLREVRITGTYRAGYVHTAVCNSAQATCMYVRRIPPHKSPQCAPFMAHAACVCVVVLNVCICARSARNIRIIACPWTSDDDDVPREGCGVRRQGLRSQELPAARSCPPRPSKAPSKAKRHAAARGARDAHASVFVVKKCPGG